MQLPLVDTNKESTETNNPMATQSTTKDIVRGKRPPLRNSITSTSSKSLDDGLFRTKNYNTAVAMAKMMTNNQGFASDIIDEASEFSDDARLDNLADPQDYNNDFDGDSMTDYETGTDLDIESQHNPKKMLPEPSDTAPKTHKIEFDPSALGRESSHNHSKRSEEHSSSGKNSYSSFTGEQSTTTNSKNKKQNKNNNSRVKAIVRGETTRIHRWRLATIIVIVMVGLLFSGWLFWIRYEDTKEKYSSTAPDIGDGPLYYQTVFEIEASANVAFRQSVGVLTSISAALTELANHNTSSPAFPFVTLPNFPELANEITKVGAVSVHDDHDSHAHDHDEHADEHDDEQTEEERRSLVQRIFWAPLVDPTTKEKWEAYTFENQGWILDTDIKEHQDHEGEDFNFETVTENRLSGYTDPNLMDVKIRDEIHDDLAGLLLLHGHGEDVSDMIMTTRFQYSSDPNALKSQQFLPAWQTFDFSEGGHGHDHGHDHSEDESEETELATDLSFVNFDLFTWFSPRSAAIKETLGDDDAFEGESLLDGDVHVWNDATFEDIHSHHEHAEDGSDCFSTLFIRTPVYETAETREVAGYVFLTLEEEIGFFREASIKYSSEDYPLRLVVKEERNGRQTPARKRTYELRGETIKYLGEFDAHDKQYDDKVYRFKFSLEAEASTSSTLYSIYPTEKFFEYSNALNEKNNSPMMNISAQYPIIPAIWMASLVMSVFAVILILFVCYGNSVEDRQRKLLRQAERTDAIVGSMFPANIQGRLMMIDDDTIETSPRHKVATRKGSDHQGNGSLPTVLTGFDSTDTTANLTDPEHASAQIGTNSFHANNDSSHNRAAPLLSRVGRKSIAGSWNRGFQGAENDDVNGDESLLRFGNTKPMADFYPNTTILMCDIAGFTAWSSARAPADVFRLLETIYGAFDDIARAEKVFKVETVGDCYVACAGLPVKQPKHAVIMARFAKKALKRYDTLIKKLETYLGPDTVDLGLRVGIHSGPVTAGVLRGDKTRFQLFGDTVNTASRMESTGRVNMIQVSPQTANLLKEEGLGKWVVPRENLVTVKGKGDMQTFWLLRSAASMSSTFSQPTLMSPMGSPKFSKGSNFWKANGTTQRRNSMGASNASWETSSTGTQSSGSVSSHPQRRLSNNENAARNSKERRLIEWMVETFMKSLKKIATHRNKNSATYKNEEFLNGKELTFPVLDPEAQIIDEIKEVIPIRSKEQRSSNASITVEEPSTFNRTNHVTIPRVVERQLRDYITVVSLLYHDHAFHNFEHCAHVLMSVLKLLSRILESKLTAHDAGDDHAYGITSDPLLEFSCLFSALIHDVDHSGVPNSQLVKENTTTATRYKSRSVAEQHSIAVAWSLLMQPCYKELRECIYRTQAEFDRFRQLVVNSVMATDIMDRQLKKFRDNRWEKAFDLKKIDDAVQSIDNGNRMATVVIEHMIQASDVAHTMQHWHVYLKFNERLFKEMYQAYKDGRAEKDPSETWYEGELNFFNFYIIPLALKLKECGVFGVSGDEYFFHAESNRNEWALKGKEIVEEYMGRASRDSSRNSSRSTSPTPLLARHLMKLSEEKSSSFRTSYSIEKEIPPFKK